MKILKRVAIVAGEVALLSYFALPAFAQEPDVNITGVSNLPSFSAADFITNVIRLIIILAFILAFIFLLIGGIRWIIAGGETKAVEGARNMVTGALIGLIIVLAAFAIIRLVEYFFNITIISGPISIPQIPK